MSRALPLLAAALLGAAILPPAATAQDANATQDAAATATLPGDPIPAGAKIQTTKSGLQYVVLKAGPEDAKSPKSILDNFSAHYTGWLKSNGQKFDSSYDRGRPLEMSVGGVIPGWSEGLQLMKVGSKYKFIIPSNIGYGAQGSPPVIPGNADLVFDVELLDCTIVEVPDFKLPTEGMVNCSVEEGGLLVEEVKSGTGDPVNGVDRVTLDYTMWLPDGTLVDTSLRNPRDTVFDMRQIAVEGMALALKLMRAGGTTNVLIPASLAFGDQQRGMIPANSDIVCRLHVKAIERGDPPLPKPDFRMPDSTALTTTSSGLQYTVIDAGSGTSPSASDTVTVHYAGWLTDGTPFDDSYSRGQPSSFPLNRVISGWTEGLQLMKPGATYIFVIPGDLAYGSRGSPPVIPPNATLVFHVELLRLGD